MWYVVQVRTGTEENILIQCQKNVSEMALERCFIPYCEEKKRIRGEWRTEKKILFPGYVFMITDNFQLLYEELRHVIGMTKLLGTGEEIVPLKDEETEFLKGFGGNEQVVKMSEGMIEGSCLRIVSGPLMGKEGYVKKIDRHKRRAYLEVEMFGRMQKIQVGLEVTKKVE